MPFYINPSQTKRITRKGVTFVCEAEYGPFNNPSEAADFWLYEHGVDGVLPSFYDEVRLVHRPK